MPGTSYVATGITVSFDTLDAELLDVEGPNESGDSVDVTHQTSTNRWREFLSGLRDAGECTLQLHYDPDAVIPSPNTSGTLEITWPSGTSKGYSCSAFVTGKTRSAPLGDKMTCSLSFKLTGEPTEST